MTQETNELIVGIDLNPKYTQVTYKDRTMRESVTHEWNGSSQLADGIRQDENGKWLLWDGTAMDHEPGTGDAAEADGLKTHCISEIFDKIIHREPLSDDCGTTFEPEDILAVYIRTCISGIRLLTKNTALYIMVTVHDLTEYLNNIIINALQKMGADRKRIYVQDYRSSFYYYAVSQKKELWEHDVAMLTYEDEAIVGYILHIDRSEKPAIATVNEAARQPMDASVRDGRPDEEWNQEKDRLFFELLKKVFERRTVNVSYLVGDYFDTGWAVRSVQYLCMNRHAYQGKNLYSKGACYAAEERAFYITDSSKPASEARGVIFGGRDMVDRNLDMEMCIHGKESLYSLVNAGVNWYEVHKVCEFIPKGEHEIRVISRPMTYGAPVIHSMRLPGLPNRPDRATRLRMTVYYTSCGCCHIDIEDLGFGGLYKSSGLTWSRDIFF